MISDEDISIFLSYGKITGNTKKKKSVEILEDQLTVSHTLSYDNADSTHLSLQIGENPRDS